MKYKDQSIPEGIIAFKDDGDILTHGDYIDHVADISYEAWAKHCIKQQYVIHIIEVYEKQWSVGDQTNFGEIKEFIWEDENWFANIKNGSFSNYHLVSFLHPPYQPPQSIPITGEDKLTPEKIAEKFSKIYEDQNGTLSVYDAIIEALKEYGWTWLQSIQPLPSKLPTVTEREGIEAFKIPRTSWAKEIYDLRCEIKLLKASHPKPDEGKAWTDKEVCDLIRHIDRKGYAVDVWTPETILKFYKQALASGEAQQENDKS